MGQSPLLRKAHLLETGLSLVRSLVSQSRESVSSVVQGSLGLSLILSLMGQSHGSVSPVVQGSLA